MDFPHRARLAGRTLVLLMALAAASCRATGAGAPRPGRYVLAFLVKGPSTVERTSEERREIQAAHLANIGRLAKERKIVVAGPFGKPVPDERLRGIFVFDTHDLGKARGWTSSDPAVKAGTLGMELAGLRTAAPLREALERDLAEAEAMERRGEKPDPGSRIRGYVMLLAREPAQAELALGELRLAGKVLIEGELVDSARGSYLAVLDATDVDAAKNLLGSHLAELGDHDLASWWASKVLAGMRVRA
jgi:uncharacterized protein YciI